jgi:8-oxo-dGTP pyrophosphatase MutT (NUDIX family)
VTESVWGDAQRVRLVTGVPSLANDPVYVRSIHAVAFVGDATDVLLVQNRDQSWTFPGGRVEGNETLDQALAREVWEEARAKIAPGYQPFAVTRIEFLNQVPGRIQRVHPTYLSWVVGEVSELSDDPHHDPADTVIGRRVLPAGDALPLLDELEQSILRAALTARGCATPEPALTREEGRE